MLGWTPLIHLYSYSALITLPYIIIITLFNCILTLHITIQSLMLLTFHSLWQWRLKLLSYFVHAWPHNGGD